MPTQSDDDEDTVNILPINNSVDSRPEKST